MATDLSLVSYLAQVLKDQVGSFSVAFRVGAMVNVADHFSYVWTQ